MLDIENKDTPLLNIYYTPFTKYLDNIIKGEDKIQYMRALELLIKLCTKDEKLENRFESQLILALNQYNLSDELTKLNILEIVPELAMHPWTSTLVIKSNFLESLLKPSDPVIFLKKYKK